MLKENSYRGNAISNARKDSIVTVENCRFTVLTSRLLRVEYNKNAVFEDRPTQVVLNRDFEVPRFNVKETAERLVLSTEDIELVYIKGAFSSNSIMVNYAGKNYGQRAGGSTFWWSFNECGADNRKGTVRTLDQADGAIELENGLMSSGPITVLDDSKSFVITEDGWIEKREEGIVDTYLFCYGSKEKGYEYLNCLKAYYQLTGSTPLLPRYALGNWWSRYTKYTQEAYINLMKRFKNEEIPISVALLDMDWHLTSIPVEDGTGWTGYTWNEELFPNHKEMIQALRNENFEVALNIHPSEGIAAHESCYSEMAKSMGVDADTKENIRFEADNPQFIKNYLELVHHPLEEEGMSFWWIDWQQGNEFGKDGIDPLWILNHFQYLDSERNGNRGLILSRYAGPGSHRYPIGFSGDSVASWETLAFQPYFTATASNIGYTWWSHDIGGHCAGYRDEELMVRWLQFGVFSPINRLHCGNSIFLGKEPWDYNAEAEASMKKFLRLRHELIPYTYTMNYRTFAFSEPIIQPLYYKHCEYEICEAENEYYFGTEMIVSPITTPCDGETKLGSARTYLPKGVWYDFFNHRRYSGGRRITAFRGIDEFPVFVKAGGIVPMARLENVNAVDNPQNMRIKVFAGADNLFELYEDDGKSVDYRAGDFAITKMQLSWGSTAVFTITPPEKSLEYIPQNRSFELEFVGISVCGSAEVFENGKSKAFEIDEGHNSLKLSVNDVNGEITVKLVDVKEAIPDLGADLVARIKKLEKIPLEKKMLMRMAGQRQSSRAMYINELCQIGIGDNVLKAVLEILMAEDGEWDGKM